MGEERETTKISIFRARCYCNVSTVLHVLSTSCTRESSAQTCSQERPLTRVYHSGLDVHPCAVMGLHTVRLFEGRISSEAQRRRWALCESASVRVSKLLVEPEVEV